MPESTRSRVCKSTKDTAALFAPSQRLCVPIEQAEYERILGDPVAFRAYLVGTTVKHAEHLPSDVLADEKHTRLNGDKLKSQFPAICTRVWDIYHAPNTFTATS